MSFRGGCEDNRGDVLPFLQSYASILYFRLPPGFRIILRGQDIQHHNLVEDLMFTQELTYKPQGFESSKDVKVFFFA
jgi:hypothetical protein